MLTHYRAREAQGVKLRKVAEKLLLARLRDHALEEVSKEQKMGSGSLEQLPINNQVLGSMTKCITSDIKRCIKVIDAKHMPELFLTARS